MSNLATVVKYAESVLHDVATKLHRLANDHTATQADGNEIADAAIVRLNGATNMVQLAKRNAVQKSAAPARVSPEASAAARQRQRDAIEQVQALFVSSEHTDMNAEERWQVIARDYADLFELAYPAPEERATMTGQFKKNEPEPTVAQMADATLESITDGIMKSERTLTRAQAYAKALRTPDGVDAAMALRSPMASLPVSVAQRKAAIIEKYGSPDAAFDNAVKGIAARDGIPYDAAINKAAVEYEDLYWLYRHGGNRW